MKYLTENIEQTCLESFKGHDSLPSRWNFDSTLPVLNVKVENENYRKVGQKFRTVRKQRRNKPLNCLLKEEVSPVHPFHFFMMIYLFCPICLDLDGVLRVDRP